MSENSERFMSEHSDGKNGDNYGRGGKIWSNESLGSPPCDISLEIDTGRNNYQQLKISRNDKIINKVNDFCQQFECADKVRGEIIQEIIVKVNDGINQLEKTFEKQWLDEQKKEKEEEEIEYYNACGGKENYDIDNSRITNRSNTPKNNYSNVESRYLEPKRMVQSNSNETLESKGHKHKINLDPNKLGEWMYRREMDRKQKRNQAIRRHVEEDMWNFKTNQCPFTPHINMKSRQLTRSRTSQNLKIEDQLLMKGKEMKRKIIQMKIEKSLIEESKNMNNTFIPAINKPMKRKKLTTSETQKLYSNLYNNPKKHWEKLKKVESEYLKDLTFHPEISEFSKALKVKETLHSKICKLAKNRTDNHEIVITEPTYTYRPKISRGPKNPNQRNVTVNWDSTYDKKLLHEKNTNHNNELCNWWEKKNHWWKMNTKRLTKIKYWKYKEVFDLWDVDKDGYLSYKQFKLSNIDNDTLKVISPIWKEITDQQEEMMSYREFIPLAEKYIDEVLFSNSK